MKNETSNIKLVKVKEPVTIPLHKVPTGMAFTGSLQGVYGSPYTGLFLKQGTALVGLAVEVVAQGEFDKPGNVFFGLGEGTVENYQPVDLEIKVVSREP